jgi:hypothetical protein
VRVELRLERDEHEYAILIEADESVGPSSVMSIARRAIDQLLLTSEIGATPSCQ